MSKLLRKLKEAARLRDQRRGNLLTDALQKAEAARAQAREVGGAEPPAIQGDLVPTDAAASTPELETLRQRFGFESESDEEREREIQRRLDAAVAAAAARAFGNPDDALPPMPAMAAPMPSAPAAPAPAAPPRRARDKLDPRKRVTLSLGAVAAWMALTAVLATWEIARWRAPVVLPAPVVTLGAPARGQSPGAQEIVTLEAAARPQSSGAQQLRLDYSLDLTRTGAAGRSSPPGPAPSR